MIASMIASASLKVATRSVVAFAWRPWTQWAKEFKAISDQVQHPDSDVTPQWDGFWGCFLSCSISRDTTAPFFSQLSPPVRFDYIIPGWLIDLTFSAWFAGSFGYQTAGDLLVEKHVQRLPSGKYCHAAWTWAKIDGTLNFRIVGMGHEATNPYKSFVVFGSDESQCNRHKHEVNTWPTIHQQSLHVQLRIHLKLIGTRTISSPPSLSAMRSDGRPALSSGRGYGEGPAVLKAASSTPVVPSRPSPSRRAEDEVGAERLWWSDALLNWKTTVLLEGS